MNSKLKNFLHYNLWKILLVIVFIASIAFAVNQCSTKVNTDFGVLYVSESEKADEAKFKAALGDTGVVKDSDGEDGVSILLKTIYVPESSEVMHQQRVPEQIRVELVSGECTLYIADEETLYENKVFDVFYDLTDMADKFGIPEDKRYLGESGEVCAIALEGNSFLNQNGAPCDSLYLAIRNHESGDTDGKIKNAAAMAEYILTNQ